MVKHIRDIVAIGIGQSNIIQVDGKWHWPSLIIFVQEGNGVTVLHCKRFQPHWDGVGKLQQNHVNNI